MIENNGQFTLRRPHKKLLLGIFKRLKTKRREVVATNLVASGISEEETEADITLEDQIL